MFGAVFGVYRPGGLGKLRQAVGVSAGVEGSPGDAGAGGIRGAVSRGGARGGGLGVVVADFTGDAPFVVDSADVAVFLAIKVGGLGGGGTGRVAIGV